MTTRGGWKVRERRGNWYVEYQGKSEFDGRFYETMCFLCSERAEAVADALNRTSAAERKVSRRIRNEVWAEERYKRYRSAPAATSESS